MPFRSPDDPKLLRGSRFAPVALLLVVLGIARVARGAEPIPPPEPSQSIPSRPLRFQASGRLGVGAGFAHGFYTSLRLDGTYRVLPGVLVGAAFQSEQGSANDDYCADAGLCAPSYFGVGPRVEFEPLPEWWVSPWLGADVAIDTFFGSNYERFGLDTTWDLGVEFRPSRGFALGPCLAETFFITMPYRNPPPPSVYDVRHTTFFELRLAGRI